MWHTQCWSILSFRVSCTLECHDDHGYDYARVRHFLPSVKANSAFAEPVVATHSLRKCLQLRCQDQIEDAFYVRPAATTISRRSAHIIQSARRPFNLDELTGSGCITALLITRGYNSALVRVDMCIKLLTCLLPRHCVAAAAASLRMLYSASRICHQKLGLRLQTEPRLFSLRARCQTTVLHLWLTRLWTGTLT